MTGIALGLLTFTLVWLFYKVTTYVLPCLIGLCVGLYAFETGAGWLGACILFGLTTLATFGLMRWLFASATHLVAKIGLSILFVAPAALASYFMLEALTAGHVPSETWRHVLCGIGAGVIGLMAFVRLAEPDPG
jgi:hypothetical protein